MKSYPPGPAATGSSFTRPGGWPTPGPREAREVNRRTFETIIIVVVLMQPVLGLVRLWAHKAVATTQPGSFTHTVAEDTILTVQR